MDSIGQVQYRISINFGGELNLANWQFVTKPPNLNFVNIIFKPWVKQFSVEVGFRQTFVNTAETGGCGLLTRLELVLD